MEDRRKKATSKMVEMITSDPKLFWKAKSKKKNWREYILPKRNDIQFWREGEIEAEKILKFIDDDSFVIDYGCGIGRITKPLRKKCKKVIGLDICSEFIKKAGDGFYLRDDFKEKEIASFVFSISVIQHNSIENRKKIIKDIHSLLKDGGKCFINFPIKGNVYKGCSKFVHTFEIDEIKELASIFSKIKIIKGNLVNYGGKIKGGFNEYFLIAIK